MSRGGAKVPADAEQFRRVMANYPTGVCVVTATDPEGCPIGMVVGTFTSVSLDPLLVGFLPDKRSSTWPKLEAAGHFCVNVLTAEQTAICRQIASSKGDKFEGIEWELSRHNLPVIAGSNVRIECRLHSVTDAGDHWFVLGRVLDLDVTHEADPMLFHRGRYGSFAELA
jgi:3-hydroxy-9,10-secoandrosta-1,3,5(10)-triene-9,17-dione monooxygenase reductase component